MQLLNTESIRQIKKGIQNNMNPCKSIPNSFKMVYRDG